MKFTLLFFLFMVFPVQANTISNQVPTSERAERSIAKVESSLKQQLASKGLEYGAPIFIRIFKKSAQLELWVEGQDGKFKLFKSYDICTFSGDLGPKLKEGDRQSPEGFYYVTPKRLNPFSRFHLSFNLGYPNTYDRYHGRTGSALMVHGNCVSIGCYAMTDEYINEIYALAVAAFKGKNSELDGQPFFRVHSFPFKLDQEALEKYKSNQWYGFWQNLKQGYDYFEQHKRPPNVEVKNGKYVFD